MFVGN